MKIWCLLDSGGWGRDLCQAAQARGLAAELFSMQPSAIERMQAGDYAFLRLAQDATRLAHEKQFLCAIHERGVKMIPDLTTCEVYEDKLKQSDMYADWLPETSILTTKMDAYVHLEQVSYPFLSKSRTGSASRNVRIITDRKAAELEIEFAFGPGLDAPHRLGEQVQRGYLLWQELLPGNDYDYRVVIVGRYLMCLKRFNKPGTLFASGSGINEPAILGDIEVQEVLEIADRFFSFHGIRFGGIDLVKDYRKECDTWDTWRILETTLGWSQKAYERCQFVVKWPDAYDVERRYFGKDIWTVLLNEIEAGVFA